MRSRLWYVSLVLAMALCGCEEDADQAALRTAQFARGIVDSHFVFANPSGAGGPLATMCSPGYVAITGCAMNCEAADSGTGVFTRATLSCNQLFDTDSSLPEASCFGSVQVGQMQEHETTLTVDPTSRALTAIWRFKGDIYLWPGWGNKLWTGGLLSFQLNGDGVLQFQCTNDVELNPDMRPYSCETFETLVNEACDS